MGCEHTRQLAAELALGIADGADRARILARVAECADCRRELERQAATADSLLLLAPEHEPPAGFELAVLREIEPPPRQTASHDPAATRLRRSRRGRGRDHGGGMLLGFGDDRRLAARRWRARSSSRVTVAESPSPIRTGLRCLGRVASARPPFACSLHAPSI
jgi:hypothetical protein